MEFERERDSHSRCERTEQLLPSGTPEKCTILTGKRASTAGIKVSLTSSETQRSQRDHFQSPGDPLCRVLAVPRSATLAPWRASEQRAAQPLARRPAAAGRPRAEAAMAEVETGDAYDCDRYLAPSLALSAPFNLPAFVFLSCCRAAIMVGGVLYLYLDHTLRHARPSVRHTGTMWPLV